VQMHDGSQILLLKLDKDRDPKHGNTFEYRRTRLREGLDVRDFSRTLFWGFPAVSRATCSLWTRQASGRRHRRPRDMAIEPYHR